MEYESLIKELDDAKTNEQIVALLNRILDISCERFDRDVNYAKEITANTHKHLSELVDKLLSDNEDKYNKLCDEVLEMEEEAGEEGEEDEPPKKKLRVDTILNEPFFTNFGDNFLGLFFNKLLMMG